MDVIEGRPLSISGGEITLEGLLHLPEGEPPYPAIVICHPHPQYGGDMYNNVVGALVRASLSLGIAALRFNFRGVGGSQGAYDGGQGEQHDVRAAVEHMRTLPDIDASRLALAGYSFGAMIALRVANGLEDLAAVVAVSGPTQRGAQVDIHLCAPSLFVCGDRDEYCDGALLTEYREQLGDDVEMQVLPGVDHFWWGSDGRLIEIVSEFLTRQML